MLLIVVRLNYMSALYFSRIAFAAHKTHGFATPTSLWVGHALKTSSRMKPTYLAPTELQISGFRAADCFQSVPHPEAYADATVRSVKLNCTLSRWALFPIEVLLDTASLEVAVK